MLVDDHTNLGNHCIRLFGARSTALQRLNNYESMGVNQKQAVAGAYAGFWTTNVGFIFELLKVRAQNKKRAKINYREEISRIYRAEGLKGFMNGYQGQLFRDFFGCAIYFTTYEFLLREISAYDAET